MQYYCSNPGKRNHMFKTNHTHTHLRVICWSTFFLFRLLFSLYMVNLFEQFSLLAVLFCLGCSSTCFTTAWHCSMATTSSWAWHCSSARQGIVHQHGIDPGHGNLEKILMKTSVTIRMQCHRLLCICHVVCCVVIIIFFYYYFPAATLGETTATTPAHCQ